MTTKDILNLIPVDFGGGCSLSKADLMYYLIKKFDIKATIDIGVYRGRSTLPQALAHKNHTGGIVYGVDPYDNELVKENDNKELKNQIDQFVKDNDFNQIYLQLKKNIKKIGLVDNIVIVRDTSSAAVEYFKKNNIKPRLIHIDGNHDTETVVNDAQKYSSLLGKEGFIIMDDVSWTSVKPAVDLLENIGLKLVFCRVNSLNDYAVFTNINSSRKDEKIAANIIKFGQY